MKKQNASGWITVRCTDELELNDDTYSDDEADNNGVPSSTYTQQEVDYIRCVILSPERERAVEEMTQLILGDQHDENNLKLFHPSYSFADVLSAFDTMNKEFKNKRLWSKKFNILFGFTLAIKIYDSWVDNNDGIETDDMIDEIGTMWKKVMKRSSADLEIDDEFTRPGIIILVQKFMEYYNVGSGDMEFNIFE